MLDRTVAYPAGGGSPRTPAASSDPGVAFVIASVASTKDGTVTHLGEFEEEGAAPFNADDEVIVTVDADKKATSRQDTLRGHLLDVAMTNIGFGPDVMVPAKASISPTSVRGVRRQGGGTGQG